LVTGEAFRFGLKHCVTRPFRVVPFFDPGPWGGQWMKEVCDLDREQANFAWCFDCVPEENSLLLRFGEVQVEVPALDLVLAQPSALLGEPVHGRFGPEFPIRFDLLDTMGGGNLSLQVHPLTQYIHDRFGMRYTQDESYYLLDAGPGAVVLLGRKRDVRFDDMIASLEVANSGGSPFDDQRFISRFPARKHDNFLIPAGTLHGSGANSMVLEISATPYIFTFKLWDWNRMGLDGKPRPISIEHGKANICWERDEDYARSRLINQVSGVGGGKGWREERTGMHETQFIETRRHWFTGSVPHHTGGERNGSVNVLNLVEGDEAIVESPEDLFEPFAIHYAETFIVPAAVGAYRIRPAGRATGTECATIKAFVRSQA
jgi:mannose-6-phosphate isomerase class I